MLFHSDREDNLPTAPADLKAAQRGDTRAFGRLVAAQQEQIYSFSFRVLGDEQTALEAAQAGVSQAARHIKNFRGGPFQLWLLRWVVAACQAHRPKTAPEAADELAAQPGVQSSLCQLPFNLRLALILVDVLGLDYSEAATVLDAPREQVRLWLAQARARLITA
jgi:RNA polymerase sigma-70 factor (ECF subfamily)